MGNAAGAEIAARASKLDRGIFSMAEYEALTKQFLSLPGATEHGYVTKTVLLSSLSDELVMLPLIEELLDVMIRRRLVAEASMVRMSKQKRDKARTIVYVHDFLAFVSVLSAKESSARKLAALYEVFDTDGDGYATKQDLARVFKVLRGAAYSSSQHMELVMGCMVQADVNADGRMSFREFARMLSKHDLDLFMSRIV